LVLIFDALEYFLPSWLSAVRYRTFAFAAALCAHWASCYRRAARQTPWLNAYAAGGAGAAAAAAAGVARNNAPAAATLGRRGGVSLRSISAGSAVKSHFLEKRH